MLLAVISYVIAGVFVATASFMADKFSKDTRKKAIAVGIVAFGAAFVPFLHQKYAEMAAKPQVEVRLEMKGNCLVVNVVPDKKEGLKSIIGRVRATGLNESQKNSEHTVFSVRSVQKGFSCEKTGVDDFVIPTRVY